MRIALMVLTQLFLVPFYMIKMQWLGKHRPLADGFWYMNKLVTRTNKLGRVKVDAHGMENVPKDGGFVLFPNHQGMYDVLAFLETCPRPFSVVAKIELKNVPLLKQTFCCLHSLMMDREDLRQSMKVIMEITSRVQQGDGFLIFPEGTRSREGNKPGVFKPGSFKSAVKAKAPIVPCALIDCFKPFDEKSIEKLTIQVHYLEPLYYEEYKDMNTTQIAEEVKKRIEKTISENIKNK